MENDPLSTDLVSRLREAHEDVMKRLGHLLEPDEWVTVYGDAADEVEKLRAALKGLSDMYAQTWDRVDGALVMMPETVSQFEAAHKKARIALGEPLIGDEVITDD